MAEHEWERVADGTAHYCAKCRMRVDDDEFVPGVEDSMCVPYVPEMAEHVKPVSQDTADAIAYSMQGVAIAYSTQGVDLGRPGGDMSGYTWSGPPSLVAFAEATGMKLSEWQKTMLKQFDKARGLQN